jgi:large subunit ribosomal protein L10
MYSFVNGQKSFFILAVHTNTIGGGPEMAKVELKQPIIDEIKAQLEGAGSIVVVDYRGITVAQDTELRKQCREAGVTYKVYKNTMVKRAVEGTEFEGIIADLEGTNSFAISKGDATLAARTIAGFIKKNKIGVLKSGVVEGTYYDEKGIATIATIPSREELLGKFLGSIQSPIANFARVIKQIAEKDGEPAAEAAE